MCCSEKFWRECRCGRQDIRQAVQQSNGRVERVEDKIEKLSLREIEKKGRLPRREAAALLLYNSTIGRTIRRPEVRNEKRKST